MFVYLCNFYKQLNKSEEILLKNPYKHNGTITSTVLKKTSSKFTKKAYIESYGCQMNFSDSEVVASILSSNDYEITSKPEDASIILLNNGKYLDLISHHAAYKEIFKTINKYLR